MKSKSKLSKNPMKLQKKIGKHRKTLLKIVKHR